MQKFMYIIFFLSFNQLAAMDGLPVVITAKAAEKKKVIVVANALSQCVSAQLYNSNEDSQQKESGRKVWMRSISSGRIHVTPPHSPSITHTLVIRDSHDAQVLAQTDFTHPAEDATFGVLQEAGSIVVRPITAEDHPSNGRQLADANKKHVHWQDELSSADSLN